MTAYANLVGQVAFQFWGAPVLEDVRGEYYCPGFIGNTYASNPWDYVSMFGVSSAIASPLSALAGPVKTPGAVTLVDVNKSAEVDRKKPAGQNGARLTVHGLNPGDVTITIRIWTPEQLRQLQILWDSVFSPSGKDIPAVVAVAHPVFDFHKINAIQLIGASGPSPGDVPQSRLFTIRAVEFVQQTTKNVTKTATASKGSLLDPNANPTPGQISANRAP